MSLILTGSISLDSNFKKIPFCPFKADSSLFRLRGRTVAYPAGILVRRLFIPEAGAVSLDPGPGMDTVTVIVNR